VERLLRDESPYRHDPLVIDRVMHKVLGRRYPAAKKRGKLVRRIVARIVKDRS
jgi:hypothetical protein